MKRIALILALLCVTSGFADLKNTVIGSLSGATGWTAGTAAKGVTCFTISGGSNNPILGDIFYDSVVGTGQFYTIIALNACGATSITVDAALTGAATGHILRFVGTSEYGGLNTSLPCSTPKTDPLYQTRYAVAWTTTVATTSEVLFARDSNMSSERRFEDTTQTTTHCMNLDHIANSAANIAPISPIYSSNTFYFWMGGREADRITYHTAAGPTIVSGGGTFIKAIPKVAVTTGTSEFQEWIIGSTRVYQNSGVYVVPQYIHLGGAIPRYLYLTGLALDGVSCAFSATDNHAPNPNVTCGTGTSRVSLVWSTPQYPLTIANYDTAQHAYYANNTAIGGTIITLHFGPAVNAGNHALVFTFQTQDSNHGVLAMVTSTLNETVLATPASVPSSTLQPTKPYPALPTGDSGISTQIAWNLSRAPIWCDTPVPTVVYDHLHGAGAFFGNSTSIYNIGNALNGSFGGACSSNNQWFYGGGEYYLENLDYLLSLSPSGWVASHNYNSGDVILESGTWFVAIPPSVATSAATPMPVAAGQSGRSKPAFSTNTAMGSGLSDKTVRWESLGNKGSWQKCSTNITGSYRDAGWSYPYVLTGEFNRYPFPFLIDYYRTGGQQQANGTTLDVSVSADLGALSALEDWSHDITGRFQTVNGDIIYERDAAWSLAIMTGRYYRTGSTADYNGYSYIMPAVLDAAIAMAEQGLSVAWLVPCSSGQCGSPSDTWYARGPTLKPFYKGLTLDALVSYYETQLALGVSPDTRIPAVVKELLDALYFNTWGPSRGLPYYAFVYTNPNWPVAVINQDWNQPMLNGFLSNSYAWYWSKVGRTQTPNGCAHNGTTCQYYDEIADLVSGHTWDTGGAADYCGGKQYNESMYGFTEYYKYRTGAWLGSTIIGGTTYATSLKRFMQPVNPCSDGGTWTGTTCFATKAAYADTIPPFIPNVGKGALGVAFATPTPTGAVITWVTTEHATSQVCVGLSPFSLSTCTGVTNEASPNGVANQWGHSVTVTGLAPSTTYYYAPQGTDDAGNVWHDRNGTNNIPSKLTFTTTPAGGR